MSVMKTIVFKGLTVVDAHITVVMPALSMGNHSMTFGLQYRGVAGGEVFLNEMRDAPYALDGGNPVEQAYSYLKTLPEFEGCTDC